MESRLKTVHQKTHCLIADHLARSAASRGQIVWSPSTSFAGGEASLLPAWGVANGGFDGTRRHSDCLQTMGFLMDGLQARFHGVSLARSDEIACFEPLLPTWRALRILRGSRRHPVVGSTALLTAT